jgi:hypothetical protein
MKGMRTMLAREGRQYVTKITPGLRGQNRSLRQTGSGRGSRQARGGKAAVEWRGDDAIEACRPGARSGA